MATDTLTPKQHQAIGALLSCKTVDAAAVAVGVHIRTLFRWLTEPAFRAALSAAEGDLLDVATRRLLTLQGSAIEVFESVLSDPDAGHSVKLKAAQSVLDYLLKLRELRNIEQRLTALEHALASAQGGD